MKAALITGILVFGGATIFALAQGIHIQVAISTGGATLTMAAGAGAIRG